MSTGKTYSTKYLLDSNNNRGAAGQVLSTTSTGIDWVDANTVPGTGLWIQSGNNIYNSNSGNVGIGTTSPDSKLDVKGTSATPADGNQTLSITNSTGGTQLNLGTAENSYGWIEAREGSTLRNLLINPNGGSVGIGTTSPTAAKLVVDSSVAPQLLVKSSSGGNAQILFEDNSGGTQNASITFDQASQNTLTIATGYQSPTDLNRINIAPAGNVGLTVRGGTGGSGLGQPLVGIGTTTPSEKLEVNGNIKVIESGQTPDVSVFHTDGSYAKLRGQGLFLSRATSYVAPVADNFGSLAVGYNGARWGNVEINGATIKFENGATERMRIDSSGNVGIGTTSPNSRLDVRRAGSGVALELHQTSGSANDYVDLKMIAGNTNAGTFGTILRHKRDGSGGGDFSILTNPTLTGTPIERMRITSAGNVGINCTPSYKLQWSDGTRTGLLDTHIGAVVIGSVSNDALALYTNLTEKMRIRPSGTVGIGHSGYDSQMLTIAAGTLDGAIYATSTDANCFASFRDNSSTTNIEYGAIGNNHVFRKDASEQMRITSTGNVGIGTSFPTGKLEIQRTQITTQFDRDSFLRLHPTTTTNSGGFTNIFFGTSPVNNYGVAIGGLRAGTDGTPSFSVRMLNDSITGTEVLNINNAGSVKFNAYNGTNNTGSPTHILGTDANGLIVKSTAGSSIGPWLPLAAGPNEPLTNSLYISSSGANGLILKKDTSAGSNSGRLFFQTDTAAEGVCIMNANGRLDFRTSSDPINTSGNIKMVLTNGGRLGIGVTSPVSALDVLGKINQTTSSGGTAASFTNSDATSGYGVAIQSQGTAATRYALILRNLDSTNIYGGVSTMTNQVGFWGIGASPTATLGSRLTVGGNASIGSSYTATSAPTNGLIVEGNVGIKNTNPQSTLHLGDNANSIGGTLRLDSFVANQFWKLEPGTNTLNIKDYDGTSLASFNGASNYVLFNGGNVGIGTTGPSRKLDVVGVIQAQGAFYSTVSSSSTNLATANGGQLSLYNSNSTDGNFSNIGGYNSNSLVTSQICFVNESHANRTGAIVFLTHNGGSMPEKMRITSDGGIGINTTNPTEKLEVNGNVKVQGNIIVNSNVGIGTTSPDALLDIGVNNIITLDDTGSSTGFIGMGSYNDGTKNRAQGASYYGFGLEIDRPNQNISFNSYASGGVTTEGTNILVLKRTGNVGIGVANPLQKLSVHGNIELVGEDVGNCGVRYIKYNCPDDASYNVLGLTTSTANFITKVGINKTSPAVKLDVSDSIAGSGFTNGLARFENTIETSSGGAGVLNVANNYQGGFGTLIKFWFEESSVASINFNSSTNAVVYNTTSDYRLKEDLQQFDGLEIVDQIKTYNYKWKKADARGYGALAHELQEVFPDAVTGEKDGEDMQGVDYSTLVPVLIKSIQELKAEIELLKQQINN